MSSDVDTDSAPKPNPRGGRPKLAPDQKRSERVPVMFTVDELAALRAVAAQSGLSVSEYMRAAALQSKAGSPARVPSARSQAAISALNRAVVSMRPILDQLGPLNNNMNQIARYLHTGRAGPHWLEDERQAILSTRDALQDLAKRAEKALDEALKW
ncbi:MAG: hypothetical protein AAFR73_12125 [Pseudomonadota bacterium]